MSAKSRRQLRPGLLWGGAAVWLIAPIVGLILIATTNQSAVLVAVKPSWVPVIAATEQIVQTVDVALLWSTPDVIVAPGWSGVVQEVHVHPGEVVKSGGVVAKIDGVDRVAWQSPGAFYRPLLRGDRGSDVIWLKQMLTFRGTAQSSSDSFDSQALAGVRSLARDLGVQGASTVTSFDPAWLLYMSSGSITAISVDLQIGAPAPPAGTVLVSGHRHLISSAIVEAGTVTASVGTNGSGNTGSSGLTASDFESARAQHGLSAGSADVLISGGTRLGLDTSRDSLSTESSSKVEETFAEGTRGLVAQLTRPAVQGSFVVPAAAITGGPESTICVKHHVGVSIATVQIVSAGAGGTVIRAQIEAGDQVRVPGPNGEQRCRSTSTK